METQTSTKLVSFNLHIIIIVILATAIVGGIVGAIANSYFLRKGVKQNNYQALSIVDVNKAFVDGSYEQSVNKDARTVSGKVTAINDGRVTVDVRLMKISNDTNLDYREVIIDSSTKIFKIEPKDPSILQAEMTEFLKKKTRTTIGMVPEPFTRTAIDVSGISVGSPISVTSLENIILKKDFIASEISIQKSTQ